MEVKKKKLHPAVVVNITTSLKIDRHGKNKWYFFVCSALLFKCTKSQRCRVTAEDLLPYGPSLHYPFVERYPLGQNQTLGQETWFQFHLGKNRLTPNVNSHKDYEGH